MLYDLRFDPQGKPRGDFVLNRPEHAARVCSSPAPTSAAARAASTRSGGLQQFRIQAVIAPSFAEIFYSNAMNNRLLLVALPEAQVAALTKAADDPAMSSVRIDVDTTTVIYDDLTVPFSLSPHHRRIFLEGLDVIGLTLTYGDHIEAFSGAHWEQQPWVRDVASRTAKRLHSV